MLIRKFLRLAPRLALVGAISAQAEAPGEGDRAELLYETHCNSCHTSLAHRRADRRAGNTQEVARYVRRWADYQKLEWSVRDVDEVSAFLVRRYYRFEGAGSGVESVPLTLEPGP